VCVCVVFSYSTLYLCHKWERKVCVVRFLMLFTYPNSLGQMFRTEKVQTTHTDFHFLD